MDINSKILKEINYRGERAVIYGKALYDDWNESDYVKLQAVLIKEGRIEEELFNRRIFKPEPYRKWFKMVYPTPTQWKENVDRTLNRMEEHVKEIIDDWKEQQEMTDGLTDSLVEKR